MIALRERQANYFTDDPALCVECRGDIPTLATCKPGQTIRPAWRVGPGQFECWGCYRGPSSRAGIIPQAGDKSMQDTTQGSNVIDSAIRPEFKIGGRACQCAGCGLWFTGVAPFDRHQLDDDTGIKCRTVKDMRDIGMVTNKYDVWQMGVSKKQADAA